MIFEPDGAGLRRQRHPEPPGPCDTCGADCELDHEAHVTQDGRDYCSDACRPRIETDFAKAPLGVCRACGASTRVLSGECWPCFADRLDALESRAKGGA